jgi:hypothetical protein
MAFKKIEQLLITKNLVTLIVGKQPRTTSKSPEQKIMEFEAKVKLRETEVY